MKDLCESCSNFYQCNFRMKQEEEGKLVDNFCARHLNVTKLPKKSLPDVYNVFLKWFPNLDTTRIDTRLAWYLANQFNSGTPLWLWELSRSGFLKTTLTNSLLLCPKILGIDQLTAKSFASGKEIKGKPAKDLGMRLTKRNRCILVNETASLKAMQQGDQRETFAIIKKLHDGAIKRDTGSGVSKYYPDCNTSIWFNSTPDFRNETIIHQEIGTCYLVDAIPLDMKNDTVDSENAIKNRQEQQKIKKETQSVVKCFLAHNGLKQIELSDKELQFIIKEANRLKFLRTTATYDRYNELKYIPQPEMPARLSMQLAKLYQSLLSLDENYDKKRAEKIIRRIIDGSGDPVLVEIFDFLDSLRSADSIVGINTPFTISQVIVSKGFGTGTIKRRLELLVGLKILRKERKPSGSPGRPGFEYVLRDDIDNETWQSIFRHPIVR